MDFPLVGQNVSADSQIKIQNENLAKGQTISKPNDGVRNSPKKWTLG